MFLNLILISIFLVDYLYLLNYKSVQNLKDDEKREAIAILSSSIDNINNINIKNNSKYISDEKSNISMKSNSQTSNINNLFNNLFIKKDKYKKMGNYNEMICESESTYSQKLSNNSEKK